ncbi:hypothetical protein INR49_019915 [Caranx melampygus]|nr:hypothetical protein INR49_019915 [Caranx melampygus]
MSLSSLPDPAVPSDLTDGFTNNYKDNLRSAARRDARNEAEDQLLFCAVFSLYCLISSEWHTQRLRNDQLETSYMVEGGQPCVTGSNPVMEDGSSSLNNGSLLSRWVSSEESRRLFNIALKMNRSVQTEWDKLSAHQCIGSVRRAAHSVDLEMSWQDYARRQDHRDSFF